MLAALSRSDNNSTTPENWGNPFLSCIILLTANDLFVKRRLIPSIIDNSRSHKIEIIVVSNGTIADDVKFPVARFCKSEYGCVAKGYNQGVRHSNGIYIAIFHDDCIIDDPEWIEKCTNALRGDIIAASPEIVWEPLGRGDLKLPIAKNVPLVMRRSDFDLMGGYDEYYYAGVEDLDFTQNILSRGKQIIEAKIDYHHFGGMSTIILLSNRGNLYRERFASASVAPEEIRKLRTWYLRKLRQTDFRAVMARDLKHFLDKFQERLAVQMGADLPDLQDTVVAKLGPYATNPMVHDRARLIDFYASQKFMEPDWASHPAEFVALPP